MEDMLITFNQSLKALGDGRIGGYLVVFGDENNTDLDGDFFTKATATATLSFAQFLTPNTLFGTAVTSAYP